MRNYSDISPNHHKMGNEETLIDYAIERSQLHAKETSISKRKEIGQIFTPKRTAIYMARFFDLSKVNFSLLDPGAGTGNLLSAVCQRIVNEADHTINMRIGAFENDFSVISYLEQVLSACKDALGEQGHSLQYSIVDDDFILSNREYLEEGSLSKQNNLHYYDAVISNPPYYKINKGAIQATILKDFVSGQPNIYSHFMTLSAHMLKNRGEFVSITPRSFCSGLYYKKIRNWFVRNTCIHWIHNFESRKNTFIEDNILQENVILYAVKTDDVNCPPFHISSSFDNTFSRYKEIEISYQDLIYRRDFESFIRIPTSEPELKVIETIDAWPHTLEGLGLRMSTGPVVDFRTKENLRNKYSRGESAPLLWMQNLRGKAIIWPLEGLSKPQAIEVNPSTKSILLPVKNYVLIKRFTSKEQNRRIFATPLISAHFNTHEYIGLENHLNYIHKPQGEMTVDEVYGLVVILNTKLVDTFFRILNGNTQVNASEINLLPLPSIDIIRKIGKSYQKIEDQESLVLDEFISDFISIDPILVSQLTKSGAT